MRPKCKNVGRSPPSNLLNPQNSKDLFKFCLNLNLVKFKIS